MIDLHCHLLPGIDDGPADDAAAIEQARVHVAAGIEKVVCTPHVSHGHRNTGEGIVAATQAFRETLAAAGVPLRIQAGAEVSLSRAIELDDDELLQLHLGASEWLLLEPPLGTDVPRLPQMVGGIQSRGHRVLIAHPERCSAFHHDDKLLGELVRAGAAAQVTAASLTGQFGRTVQKVALAMVEADLVHVIASDAHDVVRRVPGLAAPLAEAGLEGLTEWACHAVPAAMLAGEELPPRPAGSGRPAKRRGMFRRG
ncbi:MAG: hypothetical protein JHD16_02530 [Solirubrobacteraceae bacterium]|nr:hypothetical protein [Solirubrobacteraceae bacterium]